MTTPQPTPSRRGQRAREIVQQEVKEWQESFRALGQLIGIVPINKEK